MQKTWEKYKVGSKRNPDCQSLDEISHVAHLEGAVRILKDDKIRAGLVFDKSLLKADNRMIIRAASKGQQAVEYILNPKVEREPTAENEELEMELEMV